MTRALVVLASLFLAIPLLAQQLVVTIDAPMTINKGEALQWTVIVENSGGAPAENVFLTSSSHLSQCYADQFIGTFQPAERRTFACTANVPDDVYVMYIGASASSRPEDRTKAHTVYANAEVKIITPPDLFVLATSTPIGIPALPFRFDILYGNVASVPATNTVITITTPTRVTTAPEFCAIENNIARCSFGTLAGGASPRQFSIEIEAPDESAATFAIELAIDSSEDDNRPANDTFTRELTNYTTFFVTNTSDAESGSLRTAVDAANATCSDALVPCMIAFRISAESAQTIAVASPLPRTQAASLIIDGGTQSQYFPGSSVALDGNALSEGDGIAIDRLCRGGVRGMTIRNFPGVAIAYATPATPQVCNAPVVPRLEKNVLDANGRGIETRGAAVIEENTITNSKRSALFFWSGQQSVNRNVLTHNGASGIFVAATASGTDITENTIANNAEFGVAIASNAQNVSLHRNSMSGNGQRGIDWGLDAVPNGPVPIPMITRVYQIEIGVTVIEGYVEWSGSLTPEVEFFLSDTPDRGGATYLTRASVSGTFAVTVFSTFPGKYVTATATRAIYNGWLRPPSTNGDTGWGYLTTTSEYSAPFLAP